MLDNKFRTPFIALIGAVALMASAPAFAQNAAPAAPAAAPAAPAAAPAAPAADAGLPPQMSRGGKINIFKQSVHPSRGPGTACGLAAKRVLLHSG